MAELDPTGVPITVGIATVKTPGLSGNVEAATERPELPRGTDGATENFDLALEDLGFETRETITITEAVVVEGAAEGVRFTSNREPAIEVTVPAPAEDVRQVILAVDESGVITWHFGRDTEDGITGSGEATRTYLIRRGVPPTQTGTARRGLIGRLGRKVIRVLSLRVVGDIANYLAATWERDYRPYSLRPFDPTNFRNWLPPGTSPDWNRLAKGRALLFVHGTFSRADRGFANFDRDEFEDLYNAYGGRVIAFDHPTISADPTSNVAWLLSHIPADIELDLDIVCHSRGGLVSRVLAEQGQQLGGGGPTRIRVHRVVLVAVPNQGTRLADTQYFNDLLDAFSTVANVLPVPSPLHFLKAVGAVVRQIVVAGQQGLDGIDCMVPERPFLTVLNSPTSGRRCYFAVSSDFESLGIGAWNNFKDHVIDWIHGEKNDLLVSQSSAFGSNGSPSFPIVAPELLVYPNTAHVDHFGYFEQAMTITSLRDWLLSSRSDPSCL